MQVHVHVRENLQAGTGKVAGVGSTSSGVTRRNKPPGAIRERGVKTCCLAADEGTGFKAEECLDCRSNAEDVAERHSDVIKLTC